MGECCFPKTSDCFSCHAISRWCAIKELVKCYTECVLMTCVVCMEILVIVSFSQTPTEEEEEEDEGGGSPHHEEAIYTLLFQECDKDGSGIVAVDALVQYIQRMQLGEQSPQEEVYDSEEDVRYLRVNRDQHTNSKQPRVVSSNCISPPTHTLRSTVCSITSTC